MDKPLKAFALYVRCPLCGKLSRQKNFERKHKFPSAKANFSRGGRGHGFFWREIEDSGYLSTVEDFLRKAIIVLAQSIHLDLGWSKSKSALMTRVPGSFSPMTAVPSYSQKTVIPKTSSSSLILKHSRSSSS